MLKRSEITKKLQSSLSIKRYIHTLGVADEAIKLAETHGADAERAETAALLHDCAKCMPDKLKLRLCREFHLPLNDAMLVQPDLTHSFLGAEIARREYGVTNSEILNAIRYHTTGRPGMGAIEKIVYLADFFEPNRTPFDSMEKIKGLAYKSLEEAVIFSLRESVEYIRRKGYKMHELTMEALAYYEGSTKEENIGD